jgi:hypothetical protein
VQVVGGTNAIHEYVPPAAGVPNGETLPLKIPPYNNVTLKGTRVPPPTITATSFQGQSFLGPVATIAVDNSLNTGCVLEHLRITNVGYNKASGSDGCASRAVTNAVVQNADLRRLVGPSIRLG